MSDGKEKIVQRLAVKAKLSIRCFEVRKTDKDASRKTNIDYGTKDGVASVTKITISKEHLKPLTDIRKEARNYHREMTSPWGENGERILNAALVQEYVTKMRQFSQEYETAKNTFIMNYPAIVQQEQINLGTMYNIKDYPTTQELQDKFEFMYRITPVECADDFRIDIMESVLDEIKDEVREQEKNNQSIINQDLFKRLYTVIDHMVDRLSTTKIDDKTGESVYTRFHHTTIDNVKKLSELLPQLNINQLPELNDLCNEIATKFQDLKSEDIRNNEALRTEAIIEGEKLLDKIENKMTGLYDLPKIQDQKAA